MTCDIQNILLSHYLQNVNLYNYRLPYVLKSVTPYYVFTFLRPPHMRNGSTKMSHIHIF